MQDMFQITGGAVRIVHSIASYFLLSIVLHILGCLWEKLLDYN